MSSDADLLACNSYSGVGTFATTGKFSNFYACLDSCATWRGTPLCRGVDYNRVTGDCYLLKGGGNAGSYNAYVDSAALPDISSTVYTYRGQCPSCRPKYSGHLPAPFTSYGEAAQAIEHCQNLCTARVPNCNFVAVSWQVQAVGWGWQCLM